MKWVEKRLDELGFVGRGKSKHRPRDAEHLYGGPYPFIQTGDVKHADLYVTQYSQSYSEAGLAQSKLWPAGTLCITIAANIADTAILGFDACFPDSVIGFIANESESDARFVKYLFDTIRRQYQQVSQGAAQDNLSLDKLLAFNLKVPPPEVQRDIADVLSAYDDLIENNRRRMALLEESARILYHEWFVHLRFPGHEHTPIVNGVPEGWERRPLGDVCTEVREHVLPETLEPATPYIGLEHIPRRSISLCEWGAVECVTSTKHRFKEADVIFGKIRPYFHKVGLAFIEGVTSSDAIVIRANSEDLRSLVLLTVSSDEFVAEASQTMREGSKMPRADWNLMTKYAVAVPPASLRADFEQTVSALTDQLRILCFQNRNLKGARDLLLPRLMSGEIRV
jgi:type I restriction enzyme S subunit